MSVHKSSHPCNVDYCWQKTGSPLINMIYFSAFLQLCSNLCALQTIEMLIFSSFFVKSVDICTLHTDIIFLMLSKIYFSAFTHNLLNRDIKDIKLYTEYIRDNLNIHNAKVHTVLLLWLKTMTWEWFHNNFLVCFY